MPMRTILNQGSAKIYQFPAGGRAGLDGRRYDDVKAAGGIATPRVNEAVCSESWYHEAAIQEANSKPVWES
jgi:hypothetical protein